LRCGKKIGFECLFDSGVDGGKDGIDDTWWCGDADFLHTIFKV